MSKKDNWNERYAGKELIWSAGPNQLFADHAGDVSPGRALDVACGEGRNAIWLAEQGWQVDAIDFSEVGVEKAQTIAVRRGVEVGWITGDVCEQAFGDETYDLVAVLYLHTSPEERQKWLPSVISAINPGGYFIYIGHAPENIEHGVGGPQDTNLLPSAEEITSYLGGFEIIDAGVIDRQVDSDPGHGRDIKGIALDTFAKARKTA
jgi:SAM-dependent methyltransferase